MIRVDPEPGGVNVRLGARRTLSLSETRILISQLVAALQSATEQSYEQRRAA